MEFQYFRNVSTVVTDQISLTSQSEYATTELTDDKLGKSSRLSVIKVYGDGRCLFRCAAVHGIKALQDVSRCPFTSLALDKHLHVFEEHLSDHFRKVVVSALRSEQANLETETVNLNFLLDSSVGKSYTSLAHRLKMMSKPTEYAGFLECVALSHITGRPVFVYADNVQHYHLLAKFPYSNDLNVEPIRLLYEMDTRNRDGHFDIIIAQGRNAADYWSLSSDNSTFLSVNLDERHSLLSRVTNCITGTAQVAQHTSDDDISVSSEQNASANGQDDLSVPSSSEKNSKYTVVN